MYMEIMQGLYRVILWDLHRLMALRDPSVQDSAFQALQGLWLGTSGGTWTFRVIPRTLNPDPLGFRAVVLRADYRIVKS